MKLLTPEYLAIGHITKDIIQDGSYLLGGTVSYSAMVAEMLGFRAAIVTAVHDSLDLNELAGIELSILPSETTTVFMNRYTESARLQYLLSVASPIDNNFIPKLWRSTPMVHLAPVANELSEDLICSFPDVFVGVTPQGWLRQWDDTGLVSEKTWEEAEFVLSRANAVVISEEDVSGDWAKINKWAGMTRVLVATQGDKGATVFFDNEVRKYSAPKVEVVDPTGAGDTFATAFFTSLYESSDPFEACRYAIDVASFSIQYKGTKAVAYLSS